MIGVRMGEDDAADLGYPAIKEEGGDYVSPEIKVPIVGTPTIDDHRLTTRAAEE